MVKKIFFYSLFLFIVDIYAALTLDSSIESIITHFMNQQYTEAHSDIAALLKTEPDNIDALFMGLNAGQIEIVDYESYVINGYVFIKSVDSVLAIIEKNGQYICKEDESKCLFYIGTIYGMKSLVLLKLGEWIKGVRNARKSVKLIKKAKEIDPTLLETSYGIGLYNYYLGENLKWLPFMREKSRRGLADIEKVANSSSLLSFMAKNSLAWIYVEREDFDKADAIVSSVLAKYPNNTIFLRIKARIALLDKDYKNAVVLGKKMVTLSKARNPINWSDLIDAYQIIVAGLYAREAYDECLQIINEVLNLKVPASAKEISYVRKHLDYISIKKKKVEHKL